VNTTERLTKVFRQVFDDDTIVLTPQTTSDNIDGWDSLSHVNLMIAVEMEFGIEFTQREVISFANVGELTNGIESKLKK
jgi:acyl carrier protein